MVALLTVSIGEAFILVGVFALLIDRVLDALGKSRSSKILRVENTDLIRRVSSLETAEARCMAEVEHLRRRIAELETSLRTLDSLKGGEA